MNKLKPRWISRWAVMPIVFMVSFSLSTSLSKANAQEDDWSKTGLTQARLIINLLQINNCKDKSVWMGCLFAIGKLLSPSSQGEIYFVEQPQLDADVQVLISCPKTSLVTLKTLPKERKQYLLAHSKWRERTLDILERVYGSEVNVPGGLARLFIEPKAVASAAAVQELSCYKAKLIEQSKVEPLKQDQMVRAINTWAQFVFDGHSRFTPFADTQIDNGATVLPFAGIGVGISNLDKHYIVQSTFVGGGAHGSLLKGDEIVAVNGKRTSELTNMQEMIDLVKGPQGTSVDVVIRRIGQDGKAAEIPFKFVRKPVSYERLVFKWNAKPRQLEISLFDFMGLDICAKMKSEIQAKNPASVILDLRGNPGGLVDMANCISGLFIGPEIPVMQQAEVRAVNSGKDSRPSVLFSPRGSNYTYTGPIAVLVNSGSASASEVVSAALKEYNRAVIIGERTFGKGSAQTAKSVHNLFPSVALMSTDSYWINPSGQSIHAKGVSPDIEVYESPEGKDHRDGGSDEEFVSWLGVKAFEKPLLKDVRAEILVSIPDTCMAIRSRVFANFDEMIKEVKGDYQMDTANRVLECMSSLKYSWQVPKTNRHEVHNNIYGRNVRIDLN
jgi:carboxyl-terminal processing protease